MSLPTLSVRIASPRLPSALKFLDEIGEVLEKWSEALVTGDIDSVATANDPE